MIHNLENENYHFQKKIVKNYTSFLSKQTKFI